MNRRSLLKSLAAVTAGLVLPPTLAENAEAARRYWALDRTMVNPPVGGMLWWAQQVKDPPVGPLSVYDLEAKMRELWASHRSPDFGYVINLEGQFVPVMYRPGYTY